MNKKDEILERWDKEKAMYQAWESYLSTCIKNKISSKIEPEELSCFLKLPVVPRLKDDRKLVEKAFYRRKNYSDPYSDITDKVGIRFVVLLDSQISIISNIVEQMTEWECSKDRDYEKEQERDPLSFDYAAVHFVIRPKEEIDCGKEHGFVKVGTPCEVQIKSLSQHIFSEVAHDTIYKPTVEVTAEMRRNAAKAMALLEATNDYFEKVNDQVQAPISSLKNITQQLSAVYKDAIQDEPAPSVLEGLFLEAYKDFTHDDYVTKVRDLLKKKPFIGKSIKKWFQKRNPIFSQPSILLIYFAVDNNARKAKRKWPLTMVEMEPILADLGESST